MILITGSHGFIGTQLRKVLHDAGCIDLKIGIDCRDLVNYGEKIDTIIHLAADLNPTDDRDIEMNRIVHDYWKKNKTHLIYTSSASIHQPDNLYAVQKLYGEILFEGASILRLFNVYGEGGSGIVDKIRSGDKLKITGQGKQKRDFIHVDDVVMQILDAIRTKFKGVKEVGNGFGVSINSLLTDNYEYTDGNPGILSSEADKRKQLYDYCNKSNS